MDKVMKKARSYAVHIEEIMCGVFGCERFGFGGIVNSDYIRKHPFQAMCCALAKVYKGNEAKIDAFLEHHRPFADCSLDMLLSFECKDGTLHGGHYTGEDVVKSMINTFKELCRETQTGEAEL